MTYEQFDKATQIHVDMNVIYELQNTLGNAKNGRYLATIEVKKWDSSGVVIEDCKVVNHAKVPAHIMEKFEKILWEELNALKTEFNRL